MARSGVGAAEEGGSQRACLHRRFHHHFPEVAAEPQTEMDSQFLGGAGLRLTIQLQDQPVNVVPAQTWCLTAWVWVLSFHLLVTSLFLVLGIKPKALHMLCKCSSAEFHPQLFSFLFYLFIYFFTVQGFELKDYTLSHSASPFFVMSFFEIESWELFALVGSNHSPPDLCLLNS
jgi:hypothetical protein